MTRSGERLVREIESRGLRIGWLGNGIGALVVSASIGFLLPIFFDGDEIPEVAITFGALGALAWLLSGLWITWAMRRYADEALSWIIEGRDPDEREHSLTLKFAAHGALLNAIGWAAGVVVVTAANIPHSLPFAAAVGATVWLGGEATCALVYLLHERAVRPLTALALAARLPAKPVAPAVRWRLLIAWLGAGVPVLAIVMVALIGLTKSDVDPEYLAAAALFLGVVALAASLLATLFVARAIADPVTSVRGGLERVERGELDAAEVEVNDGSEIGLLQAGFNRMAEGLRERERLRDLFGRQVGQDVARAALQNGTKLGGEEREVGALFVDVTGSTSMALAMPPTEVVRLLNLFFREVIEVVESEGGFVSKFEGDAALCIFGAPVARDDPAADALRAARELADRLSREVRQIDFGIGVSAGRAVAGNVGSEQRFEYTVIGDPVNEAARLCELAKREPGRVLASERALRRAAAEESVAWSVDGSEVLRGREKATGLAHPRA
jgi:adenylate cyclase